MMRNDPETALCITPPALLLRARQAREALDRFPLPKAGRRGGVETARAGV